MSNALAIAGVTAILKNLLDNAVIDSSLVTALGGTVTVSTLPPDRVFRPENNEENRINLFLFQVSYNAGWRNVGLPSRDSVGRRLSNPPLALDLHYLLSVNGAQEFQAEILLGYAMQLLHETPVLSRDAILRTLQNGTPVSASGVLPPAYASLAAAQLAEQVEQIKIVPQYLNTEEMSRFWATFQTNYRMTVVYQASVVLIASEADAKAPLPLLTRGKDDAGFFAQPDLALRIPMLEAILPPHSQLSALPGDEVILRGRNFTGVTNLKVRLFTARLPDPIVLVPQVGPEEGVLRITLPTTGTLPAGPCQVNLELQVPGEIAPRTTNDLALLVSPVITSSLPFTVVRDGDGTAVITLTCTPEVQPPQRVTLVVGERELLADPHPNPTSTLSFTMLEATTGDHFLRLRVDGVESLLVNRATTPPSFNANQQVTIS